MKLLLVAATILGLFTVSYSQNTKAFEQTRIVYRNAKSRHKQLKVEILNKIIKPIIRESEEPIRQITVDLCPEILGDKEGERGCNEESKGKLTISVSVVSFQSKYGDGFSYQAWIDRNFDGTFDKEVYRKLVPKK